MSFPAIFMFDNLLSLPDSEPSTSTSAPIVLPDNLWVEEYDSSDQSLTIRMVCLWGSCMARLNSLSELDTHLGEHLKSDFTSPDGEISPTCQVRGCGVESENIEELDRHLKMHIFHASKIIAGMIAIKTRFPTASHCGFPMSPRILYQGEPLICEWDECLVQFDDINIFFEHVNNHIDRLDADDMVDNSFVCKWGSDCNARIATKGTLRIHVRFHSGDKYCACPFCGSFFSNNTKLYDHVLRRQEGEYTCFFCQKKFSTARLLKAHCRRHVRSFKCAYCPVALETESAVKRHVALVHAKIKPYSCEVCDKAFGQSSDLAKHMAVHDDTPRYSCPDCGESFKWQKQLNIHMRTHSELYREAAYLCHLCGNTYKTGSTLSRHFHDTHKMQTPDGFSRFQYKKCADGLYRLQTRKLMSKELLAEIKTGDQQESETSVVLDTGLAQGSTLDVVLDTSMHQESETIAGLCTETPQGITLDVVLGT